MCHYITLVVRGADRAAVEDVMAKRGRDAGPLGPDYGRERVYATRCRTFPTCALNKFGPWGISQ